MNLFWHSGHSNRFSPTKHYAQNSKQWKQNLNALNHCVAIVNHYIIYDLRFWFGLTRKVFVGLLTNLYFAVISFFKYHINLYLKYSILKFWDGKNNSLNNMFKTVNSIIQTYKICHLYGFFYDAVVHLIVWSVFHKTANYKQRGVPLSAIYMKQNRYIQNGRKIPIYCNNIWKIRFIMVLLW